NRDMNTGRNRRDYIPNDEIDREERADRNHRRGSIVNVLLGAVIVISLLAFLFVLLDSGILAGRTETLYGSPEAVASSNSAKATGEAEAQKKAEEEAARKKAEEEAAKKAQEEAEEEARKAEEIEATKKRKEKEQEERKKKEEEEKAKAEAEAREAEIMAGDYILADSNARYYTESEIEELTDREVIYALNEIYARKGRIFSGEEFREYFESKSWYHGTIPPEEFDATQDSRFNEYEKANLALLVKVAEQRGLR
ncbi:MAG: YARHG domain-containing protein, partial [Eubacteriales bacterium]|nr:YARHG domain-containing protein [Eubacteriales bacterium]